MIDSYGEAYSVLWGSYNPNLPVLRLRGDNEEWVSMEFPYPYSGKKKKPSGLDVLVEVEPGEYTVESIRKVIKYSVHEIMEIPPKLRDKITVKPGSLTYLGDFEIIRSTSALFKVVSFECEYNYDFEEFQNTLEQEYNVPETIELRSL